MKQLNAISEIRKLQVVPLAGTWIETARMTGHRHGKMVVPLAGTWIETANLHLSVGSVHVVPLAGTWIETLSVFTALRILSSRSPCGNVD